MTWAATPVVKTYRDVEVKFFDGATPRTEVTLAFGQADLGITPGGEGTVQIASRGALSHLRPGAEVPTKLSLSYLLREILSVHTGGSNPITPYEVIFCVGAAAGWASTNTDGGGKRTFGLQITYRSPTSGEQDERITFAKCFVEPGGFKVAESADGDKVSIEITDYELAPTTIKVPEGS